MLKKIYYLRDPETGWKKKDGSYTRGDPVVVIVTELDKDFNCVRYGVSAVNPKDSFNKKLGIHIATERLQKKPNTVQFKSNLSGLKGHDINKAVIAHIFETTQGQRVEQIALEWLERAEKPREEVMLVVDDTQSTV